MRGKQRPSGRLRLRTQRQLREWFLRHYEESMRVVNGSYRRSFAAATGSRLLADSGYLHHHVRTVRILRGLHLLRHIAMLSLR